MSNPDQGQKRQPAPVEAGVQYVSKRRVPRRALDRRIGLLAKGDYMLAHAYEIGEGGMLIDSPKTLSMGQRVVISFRIPGIFQTVMLGKVMYVVEPKSPGEVRRYGLQFDDVPFDTKRKIRNFVASSTGDERPRTEDSGAA